MKKLKNLEVTVTYTVKLSDIDVTKTNFDSLYESFNRFKKITNNSWNDKIADNAFDWLLENVKQRDAIDLSFEIVDLEEGEQNDRVR